MPSKDKDKIIEAIVPTAGFSMKKLQSELSIGRKKLKSATENRRNVLSDTPRKQHGSFGKFKLSFDQAQKVFQYFLDNATPITGTNAQAKVLVAPFRETSTEKNSIFLRLYDELGVEEETLTFRGMEKKYFVYNSHVLKDKYDDLYRRFCQSEFELSRDLFMDCKPFFVLPYSNQWDSMCHC